MHIAVERSILPTQDRSSRLGLQCSKQRLKSVPPLALNAAHMHLLSCCTSLFITPPFKALFPPLRVSEVLTTLRAISSFAFESRQRGTLELTPWIDRSFAFRFPRLEHHDCLIGPSPETPPPARSPVHCGPGVPSDQSCTTIMKVVTRACGSLAAIIGESGRFAPQLFATSPAA